MLNKPPKPQLRLQTWGLDKTRGEKRRQDATVIRSRGSTDKDARNRERQATKATERTMQKEVEVSTQTSGATKGGSVPSTLKPRLVKLRGPHDLVDGKNLNCLQSLARCDLAVSSSKQCRLPRNWRFDRNLF